MSTTVKNPLYRPGTSPFKNCSGCGGKFTSLGISRHWDKCPKPSEQMLKNRKISQEYAMKK